MTQQMCVKFRYCPQEQLQPLSRKEGPRPLLPAMTIVSSMETVLEQTE